MLAAHLPNFRMISNNGGYTGNGSVDNLLAHGSASKVNGIPSHQRQMLPGIVMEEQYSFAVNQFWLLL